MIERRTPLKRTPLKRSRKPLPKVGRKGERERAAIDAFRAAVADRAHRQCEAANIVDVTGQRVCGRYGPHAGAHAHHLWPEDRRRGMHVPSRGLWLCPTAHDWAHNYAPPGEAAALGLLRPVEWVIQLDTDPGDVAAVEAAQIIYDSYPDCRSIRIDWHFGRMVVPPPGVAVEWRA